MQVNTNWNLAKFAVSLNADVSDELRDVLAAYGLRYAAQRNTEIDKILGGFAKNAEGKLERIKGWKRNEVAFTPELAAALRKSFATLTLPEGEEGLSFAAEANIEEYTGAAKGIKYAEARGVFARNAKAGTLAAMATKVGFDGDMGTSEEPSTEVLQAIHKYIRESL
jgi:hypothetical protein